MIHISVNCPNCLLRCKWPIPWSMTLSIRREGHRRRLLVFSTSHQIQSARTMQFEGPQLPATSAGFFHNGDGMHKADLSTLQHPVYFSISIDSIPVFADIGSSIALLLSSHSMFLLFLGSATKCCSNHQEARNRK